MSNVINLSWSGATDDLGIAGYELSYRFGTMVNWITLPLIVTSNSFGSYIHTMSVITPHTFRIRTKDTSGQFSEYKILYANITPVLLRSSIGHFEGESSCSLGIPTIVIFIDNTGTNGAPIVNQTKVYNSNNINDTFNGDSKWWTIKLLNGSNTTWQIDNTGLIINAVTSCEVIGVSPTLIGKRTENGVVASGSSNSIPPGVCSLAAPSVSFYYSGSISLVTVIYTNVSLTTPFVGNGRFYVVTDSTGVTFIVRIGGTSTSSSDAGKILSSTLFTSRCSFGGGASGAGGVSLSLETNEVVILNG